MWMKHEVEEGGSSNETHSGSSWSKQWFYGFVTHTLFVFICITTYPYGEKTITILYAYATLKWRIKSFGSTENVIY